MAETMSPSRTTAGQIGKLQEMFGAGLRKAEELPSDAVQQAMEKQGDALVSDLVKVVRKYVEMFINMFVRVVQVNRSRDPHEAIRATGRREYLNDEVVTSMPRGKDERAEVVFFKPDLSKRNGYVSDDSLEKEYELRGLISADPYSLSAVNEDDQAFADEHPNAVHWKDSSGRGGYAAFYRWCGERSVHVGRLGNDWVDNWWFAGVRK